MTEAELLATLGKLPDNDRNLPFLAEQMRTGGGLVPFIGAGMSVPLFPQWGEFLRTVAKDENLLPAINRHIKDLEYEEAAELLQLRGKSRFEDGLKTAFQDKLLDGVVFPAAVMRVPYITTGLVITTNFDRLLEKVFARSGYAFPVSVWHDKVDAAISAVAENQLTLIKLHGDWQFSDQRVLTLGEYQKQYGKLKDKINFKLPIPQVLDQLVAKPMLFLGCSLKQDRTGAIIAQLAARKAAMRHYAIVEAPKSRKGFAERRDELECMHIRPIWYPHTEHGKIEMVLSYLAELLPEALRVVKAAQALRPDTIPRVRSKFIGRVEEKADLRARILANALVTVVGSPGAGKTRLTTEVAMTLDREFEATWFVPLAQLADVKAIPQRMAVIMKLQGQSKQELIDVVAAGLKKGRQLLIFDNCETALEECADIVAKLLKECPDLHVVLTSRMDLGALFEIGVEHVYRVPPMQSPDPDRLPDLKTLEEMDSVELLLERVRARKGEFGLTSANAPKIARLCRGLDGIPLALELVAAQLEDLSVDEVLEQSAEWLDYRGVVAGSQEHQVATLRNTIRLSYDLLGRDSSGEVARRLFRNLGVFHRGWTIEAALAVCGGAEQSKRDLQDLLKTLRHASLIEMETVRQEDRYRYLDPIREFALDELKAAGQEEALEGRHAQWAMGYAESWSPKLLGEESEAALMKLVGEADNLRGAIFWAKDRNDTEMTLRLTTALWRVFEIRALYREGGRRLEMALGMPGADKFPKLQAMAYGGLTMFAYRLGDLVTAESDAQKGLDLAQAAAYVAGVANAWNDFGIIANSRGEYQKALEFYSRSLELEKKELNQRGIAVGTYNCGRQAYNVGRLDDAERDIQTSCDMFLKAGNKREAAFALNSLSLVVRLKGRREEALGYVEESLKIRREFEDKRGVAEALRTKAGILIDQTDLAEAQKLLDESGSIVASIGDDRGSAETLEFMAWLSRARGLANETAILYAAADQQRSKLKLPLPPVEKPLQDANLDFARKELGESSFKAEWEKGRRTSYEDALGLTANQKGEAVQPI